MASYSSYIPSIAAETAKVAAGGVAGWYARDLPLSSALSGATSRFNSYRSGTGGSQGVPESLIEKTEEEADKTIPPVLTDASKKSRSPSSCPTFLSRASTFIAKNPVKIGLTLAAAGTVAGSLYFGGDQSGFPSFFSSATVDPSCGSSHGGGFGSGVQSVFRKFIPGGRGH